MIHRYSAVAVLVVLLAGCQSVAPRKAADPFSGDSYLSRAEARSSSQMQTAEGETLGGEPAPATTEVPPVDSRTPGSGSFINQSAAAKVPPPAGDIGEVTFNFEGESLHAVIKTILGEILQQNYVIAPGVSGTVTFSTAKPLRGDQALSILEMLLRWNNATLVWQDGRYTILPIAQALPGNLTPRTGNVDNARGYEVRAVPLQFISALEMEKVLKPYAKPEAIINIDPARNMIVLGGTRAELENYLQTVEVFDVDWLAGMSVGMYSLQQTEAAKVVTELEKIFGEGGNTPISGMFRFIPLEGVNGVMVITPQPKYLGTIEEWLQRFDLGSGEAGQRLYVYDVKNVKAVDLADTLNEVFGSGGGSRSGRSSGSVAPGLQPVRIGSATQRSTNVARDDGAKQETSGGGDAGGAARSSAGSLSIGGSDDVRISAVEEGNALLVRATAAQWESIRRVIDRMDAVPLQVAIEAQIISVELTDNLRHGVRWFFENSIGDEAFGEGARELARNRNIWGSLAGSINGSATNWTLLGPNVGAVIELIDEVSNLKVLSAPSLVVLNNKSASINSGTQIPVTTTSINLGTGGTNTPINSTQYVQTGITLNVTPRVNPGGLVFLEIDQEDSSADTASAAGGGNPRITQSTIQTEIAVQSGETVLLGGLIKQTDSVSSEGLPGLSRLPLVGGLFGSKSRDVARQELLVLITPKVIAGPQDTRAITEEYKRQFRALTPFQGAAEEPAPAPAD